MSGTEMTLNEKEVGKISRTLLIKLAQYNEFFCKSRERLGGFGLEITDFLMLPWIK